MTITTTTIDSLLLYELAPLERTPADLREELRGGGYDVSPKEVVASLQRLRQQGLVDGTSVYSDRFTVWPTPKGKAVARERRDFGDWHRMN